MNIGRRGRLFWLRWYWKVAVLCLIPVKARELCRHDGGEKAARLFSSCPVYLVNSDRTARTLGFRVSSWMILKYWRSQFYFTMASRYIPSFFFSVQLLIWCIHHLPTWNVVPRLSRAFPCHLMALRLSSCSLSPTCRLQTKFTQTKRTCSSFQVSFIRKSPILSLPFFFFRPVGTIVFWTNTPRRLSRQVFPHGYSVPSPSRCRQRLSFYDTPLGSQSNFTLQYRRVRRRVRSIDIFWEL